MQTRTEVRTESILNESSRTQKYSIRFDSFPTLVVHKCYANVPKIPTLKKLKKYAIFCNNNPIVLTLITLIILCWMDDRDRQMHSDRTCCWSGPGHTATPVQG